MRILSKLTRKLSGKIGKITSRNSKLLLTLAVLSANIIAHAQGGGGGVTPQAPPTASALTTVLGYLQWLGLVGGIGVGVLLAGIKMALLHDMEGAKRDAMYAVVGGIIISLISTVLGLFGV